MDKEIQSLSDIELSPEEIDIIWDKHPLEITPAERNILIQEVRKNRLEFTGKAPRAKPAKPKQPAGSADNLEIVDLDIDVSDI